MIGDSLIFPLIQLVFEGLEQAWGLRRLTICLLPRLSVLCSLALHAFARRLLWWTFARKLDHLIQFFFVCLVLFDNGERRKAAVNEGWSTCIFVFCGQLVLGKKIGRKLRFWLGLEEFVSTFLISSLFFRLVVDWLWWRGATPREGATVFELHSSSRLPFLLSSGFFVFYLNLSVAFFRLGLLCILQEKSRRSAEF